MRKLMMLLAGMAMLTACSGDDNETIYDNGPLEPVAWKLVNVSGSIAGIDEDYEEGVITWVFNTDNTVTITNNNTDEMKTDFFDSGNYVYGYTENPDNTAACANVIVIDNINFGCVNVLGDTMTFNQAYDDGYILTFKN